MTTEPDIADPPEHIRLLVREWLASLTDDQRRELSELHRRGELEATYQRARLRYAAAQQLSAMCLEAFADAFRLLQPERGR
jgi:hypothetical protein